jgi:DHA1 family bicyclomycin/chloramphenicol resistance-like MFS transporter
MDGARSGDRLGTLLILGGLSAFGPLSLDMYLPALPSLARSLHTSPAPVQVTLTGCLVGLALGQLFIGPVSDAYGRRRPLLIGLAVYALTSAACAVSPSVWLLAVLRIVQGLAGGAGVVISRAVVRDRHSGTAVARYFSLLMVVNGLAPILAPVVGGQLLRFTTWRGVFVVLAGIGLVLWLAVLLALPESLPVARRHSGGLPATLVTFRRLLTDRSFVGCVVACGFAFAAMFAYISGSSFVLQDIYGVSPQLFSVIFGTNAVGIMLLSQVSRVLLGRYGPRRLLVCGLVSIAVGGVALLVVVMAGIGLPGILPALFVVVASNGLVLPNATALALTDHGAVAGSASALLGVAQFAVGAAAAPLVGIGGSGTDIPMAVVIAALSLIALASSALVLRRSD